MALQSSLVKQPSFFVKLFFRVLKEPKYSSVIEWREDRVLLIYDTQALERAVEETEVSNGWISYNSIARQLRIYGFNRIVGKRGRVLFDTAAKVWLHSNLNSTSNLQDIVAFRRRARPKCQKRASRNKSVSSAGSCQNLLEIAAPSPAAVSTLKHVSEVEQAKETDVPSFTFPIEVHALESIHDDNTDVMKESMDPNRTEVIAVDLSQYLRETAEMEEAMYQLLKSTESAPGESFLQYIHDTEAAEDGSSTEGSSFDDTYEDILAINANPQVNDPESAYSTTNAFTFADGGLFYGEKPELS